MLGTARLSARTTVVGLAAAVALGGMTPALAAKPGPSNSGGAVACAANPNPVSWNTDFDLAVTGLAPGALVDVQISDAGGIENWNLMADSTGTASTTSHAYWQGTSTVHVMQGTGRKAHTVATCSFSVV